MFNSVVVETPLGNSTRTIHRSRTPTGTLDVTQLSSDETQLCPTFVIQLSMNSRQLSLNSRQPTLN
jgi:hypothetical protein